MSFNRIQYSILHKHIQRQLLSLYIHTDDEMVCPFIHGSLSLFSIRVNCLRLSRTMEDPQSLWKNKRWSGQTSLCRACMKTHRAPGAEGLIWNQTVGQGFGAGYWAVLVYVNNNTSSSERRQQLQTPSFHIVSFEGFAVCFS